jgi:hypothetical protein
MLHLGCDDMSSAWWKPYYCDFIEFLPKIVFELVRPSYLSELAVVLATTKYLAYSGSIVMMQRLLVKVYAQSSVFTYCMKTAAALSK